MPQIASHMGHSELPLIKLNIYIWFVNRFRALSVKALESARRVTFLRVILSPRIKAALLTNHSSSCSAATA